jgi:hypothetical protein
MPNLTMAQAYAYARQAGFDPAAATVAAAIAMAESGLNPGARGDVGLETSYWGPSVGLMQIRTVRTQTGTGGDRDISILSDPLQNMVAAYHISHGGKDWSPWSTYNDQKYRQFLGQASAGGQQAGNYTPQATQANWLTDTLGLDDAAATAKRWGLMAIAILAGGALVVAGGYRMLGSPRIPKRAIEAAALA